MGKLASIVTRPVKWTEIDGHVYPNNVGLMSLEFEFVVVTWPWHRVQGRVSAMGFMAKTGWKLRSGRSMPMSGGRAHVTLYIAQRSVDRRVNEFLDGAYKRMGRGLYHVVPRRKKQ